MNLSFFVVYVVFLDVLVTIIIQVKFTNYIKIYLNFNIYLLFCNFPLFFFKNMLSCPYEYLSILSLGILMRKISSYNY